jgi:hypothetical protein
VRVKRQNVVVGGIAVAVICIIPAVIALKLGPSDDGLAVEFAAEPPLAPVGSAVISGRLRGHKEVDFSIDGKPRPTEGRKVEVATCDLGPGLHVARLETSSDASTRAGQPLWERTVALGFLQGPFDDPAAWHPCAAQLHIGQAFLEDFADRALSRSLSELMSASPGMPGVHNTKVALVWTGDGVDCAAHLEFPNGKDLELGGHIRIWVDKRHDLHFERVGEVKVSGSQIEVWRDAGRKEGAKQGAFIGAKKGALWGLLGGPVGELLGLGVGALIGRDKGAKVGVVMADEQVHARVTETVDKDGVAAIERMLRLPPSFEMADGIGVHVRYCETLVVEPRRRVSIGFDVQTILASPRVVATPGPPERPSVEPPFEAGRLPAFAVDVSPTLLNAFLESWWRSGALTNLVNEASRLDAINGSPNGDKLEFKVEHVEPLLPPSLEILDGTAVLRAAETQLTLVSKGKGKAKERDARLFADVGVVPRYAAATQELHLDWQLLDLAATCHDPDAKTGHVLLHPCYADLLQIVKDRAFAVPNPGVERSLELPLHQLLFKGDGKRGLSFLMSHLSHISPTLLDSRGAPWVRITADAAL